jgi:hypothetical protein
LSRAGDNDAVTRRPAVVARVPTASGERTMCARYNLHSRLNALIHEMQAESKEEGLLDLPPRYNIAPTQLVPAIRTNPEGRRTLARFRLALPAALGRWPCSIVNAASLRTMGRSS